MTFKEQIAADVSHVFMNLDEFGDLHTINGAEILCIIDNNELVDREKRYKFRHSLYADGVYLKEVLIYVKASDFGALPAVGRLLTMDDKKYIVTDAINEDGIYSICLEANKV